MHDGICTNPLDMSLRKFNDGRRDKPPITRDLNPLGFPLKKKTAFQSTIKAEAEDILAGKHDVEKARNRGRDVLNKYAKYVSSYFESLMKMAN